MKALRLALSFMSIGRLFVSLLFWPMVVGLFIALGQLMVSGLYLQLVNESPHQFEARVATESPDTIWLRGYLFGDNKLPSEPKICRWKMVDGLEQPPADCGWHSLDVTVRAPNPETYDAAMYQTYFRNSTQRLQICQTCGSDIVLDSTTGATVSNVFSLTGMGVFALSDAVNQDRVASHFVDAKVEAEKLKDVGGTVFLHPPGLPDVINMTEATKTMILITNTALLIVITLWLSLKGHRKVLDYFARNDALLPLVASCGKDTFYAALWIITLVRVAFFLLMALPATVLLYSRTLTVETIAVFVGDTAEFTLWLLAILTSLCSLTIVASIAELKHRHSWISLIYRYLPLVICISGTVCWALTLFSANPLAASVQHFISAIPILGISPILLSPLISMPTTLLVAHSVLASILVVGVLRLNSRWFAAHLEEI